MGARVGPRLVIQPEAHKSTVANPTRVGARIEIQDSPEGTGKIYLSSTNPVEILGYEPGDLWMNTETGTIFRNED